MFHLNSFGDYYCLIKRWTFDYDDENLYTNLKKQSKIIINSTQSEQNDFLQNSDCCRRKQDTRERRNTYKHF